jgi:hypothetical protein
VQLAEKCADVQVGEVAGQKIGTTTIQLRGDERDELGEVALVRAHGVGRRVLVQAQVIEKVSELVLHSIGEFANW